MSVKCRPFHIPWEFTVVMTIVVYIPLGANANVTIGHLHGNINGQMSKYPEAVHIVAGDFNHADLKAVLPKFHQHVQCATKRS